MKYPGGKNGSGSYQQIVSEIPTCSLIVEAFAGSAAVTRAYCGRLPAVLIDRDRAQLAQLAQLPGPPVLICGDALELLPSLRLPADAVIYLDPPYLFETRRSASKGIYRHEFGERQDHEALLDWATSTTYRCLISGYASALYTKRLAGWRVKSWQVKTHAGPATEYLWMNYAVPAMLQLADFVGRNHTERQRLRRLRGVERR
jgi:DNA adenine methylase